MTAPARITRSESPVGPRTRTSGEAYRVGSKAASCLLWLLFAERVAYGYTDPGSGALLWQILVGAAVGFTFYFRRIVAWFKRKRGNDN